MSIRNLTIATVLLAAASASAKEPTTKPAFTLAKDTTYITKPLLPDGRPDYVEALNLEYGKGVTPKNNAAVPLVEAFGPDFLPKETRAVILKKLGMKLPEKGKYFKRLPHGSDLWDAEAKAMQAPWRTKDFPKLAEWLKSNAVPLAKVVAASKRPRYFVPLVSTEKNVRMMTLIIPSLGKVRNTARALLIRSNLALAEGRTNEAWADILAVHRLAALLEQDPILIGQLVGISVHSLVEDATVRLVPFAEIMDDQLRKMLKELPACGSPRSVSSSMKLERFCFLDSITAVLREVAEANADPSQKGKPRGRKDLDPNIAPLAKALTKAFEKGVDWDSILRRGNSFYNQQVAAMRMEKYSDRLKAYKEIEDLRQEALKEAAMSPWGEDAKILEKKAKGVDAVTRWAGSFVMSLLLPKLSRAQTVADQAGVKRELTVLSIGLAIYRAEKGRYPVRLGLLAPKYLKTVPKDFFSGKAFVYKRKGAGYVLYSVGENAKDDGGKDRDSDGDDLVVKVEK